MRAIIVFLAASGVLLASAAELCPSTDRSDVGCIMESLVPEEGTYAVKFEDGAGGAKEAEVCRKTCGMVYPNTTIALVRLREADEDSERDSDPADPLECHCAEGGRISRGVIGPQVMCASVCGQGEACGGEHLFQTGTRMRYYSIYCIGSKPAEAEQVAVRSVDLRAVEEKSSSAGANKNETSVAGGKKSNDDGDAADLATKTTHDIEETLKRIYVAMSKANVVSIIGIGLMVIVIILVLVLLVWTYLFIENFDPNVSTSLFYRRLSTPRRRNAEGKYGSRNIAPCMPNVNVQAQGLRVRDVLLSGQQSSNPPSSTYGSTNKAFDPSSEEPAPVTTFSAPMGVFVDPVANRRMTDDAISTGRPGSDPSVTPTTNGKTLGESTFYSGGSGPRQQSADFRSSQESIETEVEENGAYVEERPARKK